MKLLLCNENRGFGGSERYLLSLADGLAARGHEVHLLVRRGSWLEKEAAGAYSVHTAPYSGEIDPRTTWALQTLHRKYCFDIVHCHATRDLVVAALLKAAGATYKLIKSEHCFLGKNRSRLLDFAYAKCDAILAVSQALKTQVLRELPRLRRVDVVYNGIVPPAPGDSIPELMRRGRWIGYVSSFIASKGQAQALEAALPLLEDPNLHLLLAGDGPLREEILAKALQSGRSAQIWLPGQVSDPLPFLQALEVVLLPSHEETFSLVCLEAMALARPVVAYSVGGVPEVVAHGECATLIADNDVAGLSRAARAYLDNPTLARQHGEAGRARFQERFRFDRSLERLEEAYAQ